MHGHERFESVYKVGMIYSAALLVIGFLLAAPTEILNGLYKIITMQDLLITDYFLIAGPGAALVNAGIVTMIAINLVRFSGDPYNGFTIVELGLMSGFALFGKNFVNIWPIIFGTWLYAKNQEEPFSKYASVSLMATALAPLVSYVALGSARASLPLGLLMGVIIGFVMPSLSAYTYKIQNGMNLYNMGFACGLFALMVVPIMTGFEDKPTTALYWAEGHNLLFGCLLLGFNALLIVLGLFAYKNPSWAVWAGYRRLLSTTGRAPSDYLRMFGGGPVAGVNLYNNGFSAGLIVVVLYPTVTAIVKHRPLHLRDEDYYDLFEETAPIDVSKWRTHEDDNPEVVEEKERLHHHEYHENQEYHEKHDHHGAKYPTHKKDEK